MSIKYTRNNIASFPSFPSVKETYCIHPGCGSTHHKQLLSTCLHLIICTRDVEFASLSPRHRSARSLCFPAWVPHPCPPGWSPRRLLLHVRPWPSPLSATACRAEKRRRQSSEDSSGLSSLRRVGVQAFSNLMQCPNHASCPSFDNYFGRLPTAKTGRK